MTGGVVVDVAEKAWHGFVFLDVAGIETMLPSMEDTAETVGSDGRIRGDGRADWKFRGDDGVAAAHIYIRGIREMFSIPADFT